MTLGLIGMVGAMATAPRAAAAGTVDAFGTLRRSGQASRPAPNSLFLHVGNSGSEVLKAFRFTLVAGVRYDTAAQALPSNCTLTSPSQAVCALNSPPGNVIDFGFDTAPRYLDCAGGTLEVSAVATGGPFVSTGSAAGPGPVKADFTEVKCPSVNYAAPVLKGYQNGETVRGRVTDVPLGSTVRIDLTSSAAGPLLGTVTRRQVASTTVSFAVKLNARGRSALQHVTPDRFGGRVLALNVVVTTTLGSERNVKVSRVFLRP
jgi:hypothetical protein